MKILYLITQSTWGGAQKYVFELAQALNGENEVCVACGGTGELYKKLKEHKIRVISLSYLKRDISFFSEIKGYFELKRLLKQYKPDILHVNSSKAGVLGSIAAKKLPVKVVYTVHGAVFTAAFNRFYQFIFKKIEKWTSKYKQMIIAVSENDRLLWLQNKICPESKIITIHNGIKLEAQEKFFSREQSRDFFKDKFDFGNKKIIGTIANFYKEKNLLFLLKAFHQLTKYRKDVVLAVIGDGQQKREIQEFIANNSLLEKVFLPGFVLQAQKYLRLFDIFVLPSKKEGFPYTLLEAQLAKVPIVASKVGGIPEIISDEKTGILFEANNTEKFLENIKRLLDDEDLSNLLAENAYQRVKEKFDFEKFLEKTKKVYSDVLPDVAG